MIFEVKCENNVVLVYFCSFICYITFAGVAQCGACTVYTGTQFFSLVRYCAVTTMCLSLGSKERAITHTLF